MDTDPTQPVEVEGSVPAADALGPEYVRGPLQWARDELWQHRPSDDFHGCVE